MKREDIINMALQAGIQESLEYDHLICDDLSLERFANLVAAAEREACAKLADEIDPIWESLSFAIRARGDNAP